MNISEIAKRLETLMTECEECEELHAKRLVKDHLEEAHFLISRADTSKLPPLDEFERHHLQEDNLMFAIRTYRERTKVGLYPAKTLCEQYRNSLRNSHGPQ